MKKGNIIYICGRAHSGSTILDIVLNSCPDVISVGQMVSGLKDGPSRLCSCGKRRDSCEFWVGIIDDMISLGYSIQEIETLAYEQANLVSQPQTWLSSATKNRLALLRNLTLDIYVSATRRSGSANLVDSSKEPTRALFLARHIEQTRILHLVRDPRSVVYSHVWRMDKENGYFQMRNRKFYMPSLKPIFVVLVAAGWTVGNFLCEAVKILRPEVVLRVYYETLCSDPDREIRRIGKFLDIDTTAVRQKIATGQALNTGHLIGGNDFRLNQNVTFSAGRMEDKILPIWINMVIFTFCAPLMVMYGYKWIRNIKKNMNAC